MSSAFFFRRLGEAPDKVFAPEGAGLLYQAAGGVDLAPDVPDEHPAHPAVSQVIEHALLERIFPVGHGLHTGV